MLEWELREGGGVGSATLVVKPAEKAECVRNSP